MARVVVIGGHDMVSERMVRRLRRSPTVEMCQRAVQEDDGFSGLLSGGYAGLFEDQNADTVVYSPLSSASPRMPDLEDAATVFEQCRHSGIKKVVVLSSAAVYGATPHNPGLIPDWRPPVGSGKNPIADRWVEVEALADKHLGADPDTRLTILRPTALLGAADYFSHLFGGGLAITLPGHDPSLQLLSPDDLAEAVCCAVERSEGGVYNVAPDGVVPLRAALRLARSTRVPVARWIQRLARGVLAPIGLAYPSDQLEYIRYSWTVSNKKIRSELGFTPSLSSAEAVMDFRQARSGAAAVRAAGALPQFDDFGMDKDYIAAYGRTLFTFLHRYYWRIEVVGLEQVPREGRAVLVGVHRGLMPWDGVMALHVLAQRIGRYPRFLIHPSLVKFPFLFNFMTKLGGIMACQENADYVLERDEMLGVFPEGIRGAFTLYRDAYRLGKFGRDEFVKMALRNRAPIVPFATVGSAEIFPILGKIEWRWWKRFTLWPFFPLTPTFPILPVPLPSKWHTQFLPPIHLESRYPPEAADDAAVVHEISQEVRGRLAAAIEKMLRRRKSIFFGSVFEGELS